VFVSLATVAFAFAVGFAAQGLWLVLPFAGLELLALAVAFVCYGRHAGDFEHIELRDRVLTVTKADGLRRIESRFTLPWVRVEIDGGREAGAGAQVVLVSARQRVAVGEMLVERGRTGLAHELSAALSAAERGA